MQVITARVPNEIFREIKDMEEKEHIDRSEATRKLLDLGIKEKKRREALELLREHKLTYRKASEMMGVTLYELVDIMAKEGIAIGYSVNDLELDLRRLNDS